MKPGDKVWFQNFGSLGVGTVVRSGMILVDVVDDKGVETSQRESDLWTKIEDAIYGCRAEAQYWENKARELEESER